MRRMMLVVAAAALFGCGGPSKEQKAAEADAAKYKAAASDQAGKVQALETKVQSMEQQNTALQGQVADLEKKLSETSAQKAELETTSGEVAKMNKELQGKLTVKLSEKLLFKENSSKLTPEAMKTLDAMADALAQVKDKTIFVAGFTDNAEGGKTANLKRWQLSSARAIEVAKYLNGRGLDAGAIAVAGFGEARPVAPNDTLANKAQNRRVEIGLAPMNASMSTIDVKPATLK